MRLVFHSQTKYSFLIIPLVLYSIAQPSDSQSSCAFMTQIAYLDTGDMPAEPVLLEPNTSLDHCRPGGRTCCTLGIELDMKRHVISRLENGAKQQMGLLKNFFDGYAAIFREHIKSAIQLTYNQLDSLFQRTYGPFYISNSKIFFEFFSQLTSFVITTNSSKNSCPDTKQLLEQLFSAIYIKEFSLLNPLRTLGAEELRCMRALQPDLHPFGTLPNKMSLLLSRSLNAWKTVLRVLQAVSTELALLKQSTSLSMECSGALTKMQQCQMCSGEDPMQSKPCFNLCLNVLKGCFAELAEMDGHFNLYLASLIQMSTRLRSVYNPYSVLVPLPIQISEAIMYFQEKSPLLSSRSELRFKRAIAGGKTKLEVESSKNASAQPNTASSSSSIAPTYYYYYHEDREVKFDVLRGSVIDFVDKLTRLKGFWRSMPSSMCRETGLAAAPSLTQQCWNGTAVSRYTGKYVGYGVHNQRYNPEFPTFKGIKETFTRHKLKFALCAIQLDAAYNQEDVDYAEGSAIADLPALSSFSLAEDDEDWIDGSASEDEELEEQEQGDVNTKADFGAEMTKLPPRPPLQSDNVKGELVNVGNSCFPALHRWHTMVVVVYLLFTVYLYIK